MTLVTVAVLSEPPKHEVFGFHAHSDILHFYGFYILQCLGLVQCKNCTVNEFKSLKTGLCCQLCPAGEYMTKECTGDTQTTCQACPNNEFTSTSNNLTSCQKCRSGKVCDGGRLLVSCTPTSDVQCKCPANKYYDTHTLRCGECTECGRGERVLTPCQTYQDATCEECPKVNQNNIFI